MQDFAEINSIHNARMMELFKNMWLQNDFSQATRNQRLDFRKLGLVKSMCAGFYMPTQKGCTVIGITMDEALRLYKVNCSTLNRGNQYAPW